MQEAHESNDDRLARRRARRWSRRARIFAPFLAVPGMLGVLMLSVNLIEHQPAVSRRGTPSDRSTTSLRPAERWPERATSAPIERRPVDVGVDRHALSQDSVIATVVAADMPLAPGVERMDAETTLFGAPAPTTAMDGER